MSCCIGTSSREVLIPTHKSGLPSLFLDLKLNKKVLGRIFIQLRTDICPETCQHFLTLLGGSKNAPFHRVVANSLLQCKLKPRKGFPKEETSSLKHDTYAVSMLESEFFIYMKKTPWLNENQTTPTVFGKVVDGTEILFMINEYGSENGKVSKKIFVSNFGLV